MKKVAVIGAGAAGLCCARHLKKYPERFQIRVLEKMKEIGGTWVYSPSTGEHTHSSMYKNLRTNLPKEIMFFPGFPFPSHLPSFVHHSQVLEYLHDYASHYDINKFISFETVVDHVKPVLTGGTKVPGDSADVKEEELDFCHWGRFQDSVRWQVTTRDITSGVQTAEVYDAVLVCNGHFSTPAFPAIHGLPHFPGHVIHSHVYREPEAYKNQTVLVVGTGQSGRDIILDLSTWARQVYMSNRGPSLECPLPQNVEEMPGISEIGSDRVVHFTDGNTCLVDSIILATGYDYSFPFLKEDTGIKVVSGKRITPLYKHTFNSLHPSLAFIGINFGYNPLPYFDYQVRWVLSVWCGDKTLPSMEDMIKDDEQWYQNRLQMGLPPHKAGHYLGPAQWELIDLFAEYAGNQPLAPVMEMLYNEIAHQRRDNLMQYKDNKYLVLDEHKWTQVNDEHKWTQVK